MHACAKYHCVENMRQTYIFNVCIVLTAADVKCVVANTRKMANWMMCCMLGEESCCSIVRYSTCDNVACHLGAILLYYHIYSNSRLHEYTASSPLTSFTEEVK